MIIKGTGQLRVRDQNRSKYGMCSILRQLYAERALCSILWWVVLCLVQCWAMEHSQAMSLPDGGNEPSAWKYCSEKTPDWQTVIIMLQLAALLVIRRHTDNCSP